MTTHYYQIQNGKVQLCSVTSVPRSEEMLEGQRDFFLNRVYKPTNRVFGVDEVAHAHGLMSSSKPTRHTTLAAMVQAIVNDGDNRANGVVFCADVDANGFLLPVIGSGLFLVEAGRTNKTIILPTQLRNFASSFDNVDVVICATLSDVMKYLVTRLEFKENIQEATDNQHVLSSVKQGDRTMLVWRSAVSISDDIEDVIESFGPPQGKALQDLQIQSSLDKEIPDEVPKRPVVYVDCSTSVSCLLGDNGLNTAKHGVLVLCNVNKFNSMLLHVLAAALEVRKDITVIALVPACDCDQSKCVCSRSTQREYQHHLKCIATLLKCNNVSKFPEEAFD